MPVIPLACHSDSAAERALWPLRHWAAGDCCSAPKPLFYLHSGRTWVFISGSSCVLVSPCLFVCSSSVLKCFCFILNVFAWITLPLLQCEPSICHGQAVREWLCISSAPLWRGAARQGNRVSKVFKDLSETAPQLFILFKYRCFQTAWTDCSSIKFLPVLCLVIGPCCAAHLVWSMFPTYSTLWLSKQLWCAWTLSWSSSMFSWALWQCGNGGVGVRG